MKRRFTQAEVYYLNTLPAVERASMDRITYSRDFQVRCMAQYLRGNVGRPIRRSCWRRSRSPMKPRPINATCSSSPNP